MSITNTILKKTSSSIHTNLFQGFNPIELNPEVWFDSSNILSGLLQNWIDQSSNSRDATQNTSTNRPTSGSSTVNGRNVITFDGADNYMNCSRAVQDDWTISVVCRPHDGNANLDWFQSDGLFDAEVAGVVNDYGMSVGKNGSNAVFKAGVGNADITITSSDHAFNLPYIVTFTRNAANGAIELFVNGTSEASGTGPTGTRNASSVNNIGIIRDITSRCFDGDLCEIVAYGKILNDSEINSLNRYFANKWGISL